MLAPLIAVPPIITHVTNVHNTFIQVCSQHAANTHLLWCINDPSVVAKL